MKRLAIISIVLILFSIAGCSSESLPNKSERKEVIINLPTDDTVGGYKTNSVFRSISSDVIDATTVGVESNDSTTQSKTSNISNKTTSSKTSSKKSSSNKTISSSKINASDKIVSSSEAVSSNEFISSSQTVESTEIVSSIQNDIIEEIEYCANLNSKIFHKSTCGSVKKMKEENKFFTKDRSILSSSGYTPCKNCNP